MGFNTTIFILNDRLDEIERHPEQFVRDVVITAGSAGSMENAVGQTTIMKTQHADVFRLYATRHNSIVELDVYADRTVQMIKNNPHAREFVEGLVKDAQRNVTELKKLLKETEAEETAE